MPQSSPITHDDSIAVYTDGSCHTQLKSGGWAALLFVNGRKIVLEGEDENTTHHRMELKAVISSLTYLRRHQLLKRPINLYSDSQYVVDLVKRKDRLVASNFLTKKLQTIRNDDLVKELIPFMQHANVNFIKIKSHQNLLTPHALLNREVDMLSRKNMRTSL